MSLGTLTNEECGRLFEKIKQGQHIRLLNVQAIYLINYIYTYDDGILPVKINKGVAYTDFKKN